MVCRYEKIHDDQQRDNRGADRQNDVNSLKPEGNQQSKSRLRSVGSRTQRIQPEDWNSRRRPDLLGALLGGGNRFSQHKIKNGHVSRVFLNLLPSLNDPGKFVISFHAGNRASRLFGCNKFQAAGQFRHPPALTARNGVRPSRNHEILFMEIS